MKKLFALFVFFALSLSALRAQPNVPTVWTVSDSGSCFYIIQAPVGYSAVNYYVRKAGASVALTVNDSVVLCGTVSASSLQSKVGNHVRFAFYKNSGGYATNIGYPLYSASNPFQVYGWLNNLLMGGYGFVSLNTAGGTVLQHYAGTLNNISIDSAGTGLAYVGVWDGFDTTGVYLGGLTMLTAANRIMDYRFKKGLYVKIYGATPGRVSFFFTQPPYNIQD